MRKRLLFLALVVALAFTAGVVPGKADELLLPDVSLGLPGWSIDRYAPVVFSYLSAVNGINNVIDLGIGTTGNFANRPSAYQSSFYNTQGENNAISGGPGDHLSVLLYIPGSWSSPTNGDVRTDLWVNNADSAYGILGFSNFGTNNELGLYTAGTFQTWNDVTGAWTVPAVYRPSSLFVPGLESSRRVQAQLVVRELSKPGTMLPALGLL